MRHKLMLALAWGLIFALVPVADLDRFNEIRIFNEQETRSRILMLDGHMYFHAAKSKNISFVTSADSSIYFGAFNLQTLASVGSVNDLRAKTTGLMNTAAQVDRRLTFVSRTLQNLNSFATGTNLKQRQMEQTLSRLNQTIARGGGGSMGRRLRMNVEAIKALVLRMDANLKKDECASRPCQHGGTCIDLYNKFLCLCPPGYTGAKCDSDVNECNVYRGTDIGCQNGATCENKANGFRCHCAKGFYGTLCALKTNECRDNGHQLCGEHGACIPHTYDSPNRPNYKCICDAGFRPADDQSNPTCVDVDECASNPCYPGATCVNLPGAFKCSGCPIGMTGNGVMCVDIDECSQGDSVPTCSKSPPVQCINTLGSFTCAPCPAGFTGDGRFCRKLHPCETSPCFPTAKCIAVYGTLNENAFRCECPENMVGDGIGTEGCFFSNTTVCKPETCLNRGKCQPLSDTTFKCACTWGFAGERCQLPTPCLDAVCGRQGVCIPFPDGGFKCRCRYGYYGDRCEFEEDGCGEHTNNETGTIKYPNWSYYHFGKNKTCEWTIRTDNDDMVIELNFTQFHLPSLYNFDVSNCSDVVSNLTIYDGPQSTSPMLAVFCGFRSSARAPILNHPIVLSSSNAFIRFRSHDVRLGVGGFTLTWRLVPKKCGQRLYDDSGEIVLSDIDADKVCQWYITAEPGMHLELLISQVLLPSGETFNCSVNSLEVYDGMSITGERISQICSNSPQQVTFRTTLPYAAIYFRSLQDEFTPRISETATSCISILQPGQKQSTSKCRFGFSIKYRAIPLDRACGDRISENDDGAFEGTISSPNFGFNYFPNLDCVWILDASTTDGGEQNIVSIAFDVFDIPTIGPIPSSPPPVVVGPGPVGLRASISAVSDIGRQKRQLPPSYLAPFSSSMGQFRCPRDYLAIRDGDSPSSPIIDRFCNDNRPGTSIVSTGSTMYIQFHTDGEISGKGFKLSYTSACERHFTSRNGTIQSSNYPSASPNPFLCTYVIDAKPDKAIKITFNYIGLEYDIATCYYQPANNPDRRDYIEFSGGNAVTHEQLNKRYICARYPFHVGGEIVSSANRPFRITYSTSGSAGNTGFLFTYQIIDVGCGGVFNDDQGTITSPSYPDNYLSHMYCIYLITVSDDKRVQLSFDAFDLEVPGVSQDCSYDNIRVYDSFTSEEENEGYHGIFCGSLPPPTLLSNGNEMAIVFVSDRSVGGSGFSARFTAIDADRNCDRTFTAPSGAIEFRALEVARAAQCIYHISVPTRNRIALTIRNMTMPCETSRLQFRNGLSQLSPGFPGLYEDSEMCDGRLVTTLRSQGNRLFIKFSTRDASQTAFNITYETIASGCGGRIRAVSGSLSAPQYPLKDARSMTCEWHLAVAEGNQIRVLVTHLDNLNSASDAGFCSPFSANFLDITDGPSPSDRVLRRFCRRELGVVPVTSETNAVTVRYRQHGGNHFPALFGFLAQFNTVCTDVVHTAFTGRLQSPGFPDSVYESRFCKWRIVASPGTRIQLVFHDFRIENAIDYGPRNNCPSSYLEIGDDQLSSASVLVDGRENETTAMRRFCTRQGRPLQITSKTNIIDITFASQAAAIDNHFSLTWTTIGCGGVVSSPGKYPFSVSLDDLQPNVDYYECRWTIRAPIGLRVLFNVSRLRTAGCDDGNSGFAFYSGTTNASGVIQKVMCADAENYSYKSQGSELFVVLRVYAINIKQTADRILTNGSIMFVQPDKGNECGAVVQVKPTDELVSLHSPNFPRLYPKAVECIWQVIAPHGHRIHFNLTDYHTPNYHPLRPMDVPWRPATNANYSCTDPYVPYIEGALALYAGNSTQGELLQRFCTDQSTFQIIQSPSNEALVIFKGAPYQRNQMSGDDDSDRRFGFLLEIRLRCGDLLTATSTPQTVTLHQVEEGGCSYLIKAAESGERIYLRLDHVAFEVAGTDSSKSNYSLPTITVYDGDDITNEISRLGSLQPYDYEAGTSYVTEFHGESTMTLNINTTKARGIDALHFTYFTANDACGGSMTGISGTILNPPFDSDYECVWTIAGTPGNQIAIDIPNLAIPKSEYCAASYLEIREFNETGPNSRRFCGDQKPNGTIMLESAWIKLRIDTSDRSDESSPPVDNSMPSARPQVKLLYKKNMGIAVKLRGRTQIVAPIDADRAALNYGDLQWFVITEMRSRMQIHFDQLQIPEDPDDERTGLTISKVSCDRRNLQLVCATNSLGVFTGWNPPQDIFVDSYFVNIRLHSPRRSSFALTLTEIPAGSFSPNGTYISPMAKLPAPNAEFNCGQELVANWTPKFLTHPPAPNVITYYGQAYANNLKCRWLIRRPPFHGIRFKIIEMDLEEHPDCRFDWLAFGGFSTDQSLEEIQNHVRFCKKGDRQREIPVTYEKYAFIYFFTDRSRAGRGFRIEYSLTCSSFEFVPRSIGVYESILESPGYPTGYSANLSCYWALILETNRQLSVDFLDMDLEDSANCAKDSLTLHQRHVHRNPIKICGTNAPQNFTTEHGMIAIRFTSDSTINKRGFKLRIAELVHDCSIDRLSIDENDPIKVLHSPHYPKLSPNSLECQWTIYAPVGHRIKFTVDPTTFDVQSSDFESCNDDLLEIRDGASITAPLVGQFCHFQAPSTIFSTGSALFVRYHTDSSAQSVGWNATYELASCGGSVVLAPDGDATVSSPYYPEPYPQISDCEWMIYGPSGHFINATLNHMWLAFSDNCSADYIALRDQNATGQFLLAPSCLSSPTVIGQHWHSSRNALHLRFAANHTLLHTDRAFCLNHRCGFEMAFNVSKISCGGVIDSPSGIVFTPGYPDRLMSGLHCEWEFHAGSGFRYLLEFTYIQESETENEVATANEDNCFADLEATNGELTLRRAMAFSSRQFCYNQTKFVSTADLVSLVYDDGPTRYQRSHGNQNINWMKSYRPFHVKYLKVPNDYDDRVCSYFITENSPEKLIQFDSQLTSINYCHIRIERREPGGTTVLRFTDFMSTKLMMAYVYTCSDYLDHVIIQGSLDDPTPFQRRICSATMKNATNITLAYSNSVIDIHIISQPRLRAPNETLAFNLYVDFQKCGGILTQERGVIASPNYGANENYPDDLDCIWTLKAREGSVIKIKMLDLGMEDDVQCAYDVVSVKDGAGPEASIIHNYCKDSMEHVEERFRNITSNSRFVTIEMKTDGNTGSRGFKLEYEMVADDGNSCGYVARGLKGTIYSPGYPNNYRKSMECLWDIAVPIGYHVRIDYLKFDIEESTNCEKDSLIISQEHQSRAAAPLGDYYFIFEQEDHEKPLCGRDLPPVFRSESNRIRVNFSSDDSINAKGFMLNWTAECGTTFRLSHGVITSPNYPLFYPNMNMRCHYRIQPADAVGVPIIVLKILDLELDNNPHLIPDSSQPLICIGDYVEITDVFLKKTIGVFCRSSENGFPPISIKGPIDVLFASNRSYLHDTQNNRKEMRGFQISFAVSNCGGEINLKDAADSLSTAISSPGFPLPYHHDLDCLWNITAPDDRILVFKYQKLEIEVSSSCRFDYLEIFDGPVMSNVTSKGRMCGDKVPESPLTTSSSSALVRFVSDRNMARGGFQLIVTATLGPASGCGGSLSVTDSWQVLNSPSGLDGNYLGDLRCTWLLKAPMNKIVELQIEQLILEPKAMYNDGTEKCADYLTVFDGFRLISPVLLVPTCGTLTSDEPLYLHSSNRVISIYFQTDSTDNFAGFRIKYQFAENECGVTKKVESGDPQELTYESPRTLTRTESRHQRCRFVLYSQDRSPIEVDFTRFSFPSTTNDCSSEYVEIRDVGFAADCRHAACGDESRQRSIVRSCGKLVPPRFVSSTAVVQVAVFGAGRIALKLSDSRIEITTSAVIRSTESSSFALTYQNLNACNRTVDVNDHPTGRLTSPNYPNPYDHNSTCSTRLRSADAGTRILVVFSDFQLEEGTRRFATMRYSDLRSRFSSSIDRSFDRSIYNPVWWRQTECQYDYVTVSDGQNTTSRYCGSALPSTFFSSTSEVEIFMRTDATMAPGGYEISYFATVPMGLSTGIMYDFGTTTDHHGAITNIGYPGYDNGITSLWTISPPKAHSCRLIFMQMAFGSQEKRCETGDRLLMRMTKEEEPKEEYKPLPCRAVNLPLRVAIPTGSSVELKWITDGSTADNGDGFRVQWECDNLPILEL